MLSQVPTEPKEYLLGIQSVDNYEATLNKMNPTQNISVGLDYGRASTAEAAAVFFAEATPILTYIK